MKTYTEKEVLAVLRQKVALAGGQAKFGYENGFAPSFVCYVLSGKRRLTDRMIEALGFDIRYVKKGTK